MRDHPPLTPWAVREQIARLVNVAAAEIADDHNLVELGLDSILIMRLAQGWRRSGADVTFSELVEHPTLGAWQERLGNANG